MKLTIKYGPAKSGKTRALQQEVLKAIEKGKVGLYSPHPKEVMDFLYGFPAEYKKHLENLEMVGEFITEGPRFFDDAHELLSENFEPQDGDYFTFPAGYKSKLTEKLTALNN